MKKGIILLCLILITGCSQVTKETVTDIVGVHKEIFKNDKIFINAEFEAHAQGMDYDSESGLFFISFTNDLISMDLNGDVVHQIYVGDQKGPNGHQGHYGDLQVINDLVYVAYAEEFNVGDENNGSAIKVYDKQLNHVKTTKLPDIIYGAGAITHDGEYIYVGGGMKKGMKVNHIFKYDYDLNLIEKIEIEHETIKGYQTLFYDYEDDSFYFNAKGHEIAILDNQLNIIEKTYGEYSWGLSRYNENLMVRLVPKELENHNHTGYLTFF